MNKKIKGMFGKNKGFTLIELLVVIAIIGILSSIVLASLNTARVKGRDAKRVADIKQIQTALEMYADSNNGAYPTGLIALENANFIPRVPTPPAGTTATSYFYAGMTAGCVSYHLGAELEDAGHMILGTDIDNAQNNAAADACNTGDTDFNGSGAAANGDDATTPIYDVTP